MRSGRGGNGVGVVADIEAAHEKLGRQKECGLLTEAEFERELRAIYRGDKSRAVRAAAD